MSNPRVLLRHNFNPMSSFFLLKLAHYYQQRTGHNIYENQSQRHKFKYITTRRKIPLSNTDYHFHFNSQSDAGRLEDVPSPIRESIRQTVQLQQPIVVEDIFDAMENRKGLLVVRIRLEEQQQHLFGW